MNRYDNGQIYKLVNSVDDSIYIGSTCMPLAKRKASHKRTAKKKPRPVHLHLNEIGWKNVRIILIEEWPCGSKKELLKREQHWIDELQPELNRRAAYLPPCPHGRQHAACKECGGTSICPHSRRRQFCKPCGGSGVCLHGRQKYACKPCGGSGVCLHEREKNKCKKCSPFTCDYCKLTTSKGHIRRHYRSVMHLKAYTAAYVDCFGEEPTEYPFHQLVH